jgi:hypothetical protein
MDYNNGIKPDKMRFYKNIEYIGVKTDYPLYKNFNKFDVKSIEIKRFFGKPYNKYEYNTYFIFSQNKWNELLQTLSSDAEKYNMEVYEKQGIASLSPIWIHS